MEAVLMFYNDLVSVVMGSSRIDILPIVDIFQERYVRFQLEAAARPAVNHRDVFTAG